MLGYSAYLQPVGPGLLLGLGQDADGDGRVQGLQLSLFDVTNPAAPRRVSQLKLPEHQLERRVRLPRDHRRRRPGAAAHHLDGRAPMGAPTVEVAPAPATEPATVEPTAPDSVPGEGAGSAGGSPGSSSDASSGSSGSSGSGTSAMPVMPSSTTVLAVPSTGRRFGTPHTLVVPSTDQGSTTRTFVDARDIWTLTNDSLADHDRTTWRRVAVVRF